MQIYVKLNLIQGHKNTKFIPHGLYTHENFNSSHHVDLNFWAHNSFRVIISDETRKISE